MERQRKLEVAELEPRRKWGEEGRGRREGEGGEGRRGEGEGTACASVVCLRLGCLDGWLANWLFGWVSSLGGWVLVS